MPDRIVAARILRDARNDFRTRIVGQNVGFVIVDVIIAFVYRIEQKVKCRIQILPVELAQHFTAVIMKLAVIFMSCVV